MYIRPPAMKPDIHNVVVGIDGDRAFAYEPGARRALIIPASCVFDKREDADRFLAGTGPFKWCVAYLSCNEHGDDESGYVMFEARVVERVNRSSRWGSVETLLTAKNPTLDEKVKRPLQLEVFNTKREASAYMRQKVKSELESAAREVAQWSARVKTLTKEARCL